jgi:hypothetical protein
MKRDLVYTTDHLRLRCLDLTRFFGPPPHQNRRRGPPVEKVGLSYDGVPVELADRPPSHDELLETESGPRMLSGFLIRRQADRAHTIVKHGATVLKLHFKH